MSFLTSLKNKALELFEPENSSGVIQTAADTAQFSDYKRRLNKDEKFRLQFGLPDSQKLLADISVEVALQNAENPPVNPGQAARSESLIEFSNVIYQGKLYLSDSFLCFTATDARQCSFALPLLTVKRVERLPLKSYLFALSIKTYNGLTLVIQFIGIKSACDRFSLALKAQLGKNLAQIKSLKPFLATLYSEYLLNVISSGQKGDAPPPPLGGLGQMFRYPGDAKKLRDKSKMRLWLEYFQTHGRNLTLVRQQTFYKLIRVGLPNRLRGEIWELTSGSLYLRLAHQSMYKDLLEEYEGKTSQATEEIEKDLNRSLPEYSAYQDEEGINRLRRVLTVYSWKNPDVGYCQAMNIVIAAFLIYMSEEQAFWCLNVLCDKMLPGYYSKSMYGTLLDQKVFESLVEKTMPLLWDHLQRCDVQLSVVSLPWFLSIFINSMPLVFAFRIIDVFFLEGPKLLFQVALAILRINGERLLDADDDGLMIGIIKEYFLTLDQSAHPNSKNEKLRSITKFQELMVVAMKEFSVITEPLITEQRAKYQDRVLEDIEIFAKRTSIRNLHKTKNLTQDDLSVLYDRYHTYREMNLENYQNFLSSVVCWTEPQELSIDGTPDFLRRLYTRWDADMKGTLSLQNVVTGIDALKQSDLMGLMTYFFELYDDDGDGQIDREGILSMSEGLLFLTKAWREGTVYTDGAPILDQISLVELDRREQERQELLQQEELRLAEEMEALRLEAEQQKNAEDNVSEAIFENPDTDEDDAKSTKSAKSAKSVSSRSIKSTIGSIGAAGSAVGGAVGGAVRGAVRRKSFKDIGDPIQERQKVAHEQNVRYLSAVSAFIQRAFEYANEAQKEEEEKAAGKKNEKSSEDSVEAHNAALDPSKPLFIDLPTFRMVVLADETLETLFAVSLPQSVILRQSDADRHKRASLRDVFDGLVADGMRVAGEVRKRIDIDKSVNDSEDIGEVVSGKDRDVLDEVI